MTDYIDKKSWWRKNQNWIVAISVMMLGFFITVLIILEEPIGDFTKAIADPSVYDNAFEIVEEDERVIELLGALQPIGFFEVLEGEVRYKEDNNKAMMTVGIIGSKRKGKMDIIAYRKDSTWQYQEIRIRTKKPKAIIEVLDLK